MEEGSGAGRGGVRNRVCPIASTCRVRASSSTHLPPTRRKKRNSCFIFHMIPLYHHLHIHLHSLLPSPLASPSVPFSALPAPAPSASTHAVLYHFAVWWPSERFRRCTVHLLSAPYIVQISKSLSYSSGSLATSSPRHALHRYSSLATLATLQLVLSHSHRRRSRSWQPAVSFSFFVHVDHRVPPF
jgi:hypothetical protein